MPSKAEVLAKLTKLGIEHDPSASFTDLTAKLKEATKANKPPEAPKPPESGAGAGEGADIKPEDKKGKDEKPTAKSNGHVMKCNVLHNTVFLKEGDEVELSEADEKLFRSEGFID